MHVPALSCIRPCVCLLRSILGIGGDNSDGATGTFYEGVMTHGYSSNATDAAVQANIVAAGYGGE